jgi:hypothetical protein
VPEVWLFKNYRLIIYQLEADRYVASNNSRYFPDVLIQETIVGVASPTENRCFATAKEKGTGAAISELRRYTSGRD